MNANYIGSDLNYISQLNFIRGGIICYIILIILLAAIYQQPSPLVVVQTFVSQAITIFLVLLSLGVVARPCDRATTELVVSKGLRSGLLSLAGLCRSGVHTKLGVNMVNFGEPSSTRLHKEERTGSGWKHSRPKFPRQTEVGLHS